MLRRVLWWFIGGLALTVLVAFVFERTIEPARVPPTPTAEATGAALPHLPAFTPSSPCALENAEVHDDATCYNERVEETEVADAGTSVLILRKEHVGSGCFGSISSDRQSLRLCDRRSGSIYDTLIDHVAGELHPSPDGAWLAVTSFDWGERGIPILGVHKVRRDGSGLTRLDTQGFPKGTVGVSIIAWEPNGAWLIVELWDGSENGWTRHRLKADGSGAMEPPATPQDEG